MNTDSIKKVLMFPFVRPNTYTETIIFIILWTAIIWAVETSSSGFFMLFYLPQLILVDLLTYVEIPPTIAPTPAWLLLNMEIVWLALSLLVSVLLHMPFKMQGSKASLARTAGVVALSIPLSLLFVLIFIIPATPLNLKIFSPFIYPIVTAFIMYRALLDVHQLGSIKTGLIVAASAIISYIPLVMGILLLFMAGSGGPGPR